ncbi:ParB N-terminal domain-containing protein [Dactylosporangium sp. NPDC051541]|uniref:ParB/RepB/Spo0J family partition protein n=1 Tax=Dactylosporangium sp. NPDC051541 TaxID=3363977 RepID=UPI0037B6989C
MEQQVGVSLSGPVAPAAIQPYTDDPLSGCSEPQWLPVRSLLPADSPRESGEDLAHTRMLAGLDAELPPIIVHRTTMRVIDGMHRLGAARMRGDELIPVRFFDGTEQEAFVLAVRTNIAHGLPLSHEDRTRAAERIIGSHPNWSDRAIAAAAGLGARTIGNIRRRLQQHRDGGDNAARTGRDGRVRPLNNVEGRIRVSELIRERPDASLREIAREAGVSPSTVRDVRLRIERGENPLPAPRPRRDSEPADDRMTGPDLAVVLQGLQNDPALRFSESGRGLLRWIFSRALRADEWVDVADKVPPHCTYIIADLARTCAEEWRQLAEDLEERGAKQA